MRSDPAKPSPLAPPYPLWILALFGASCAQARVESEPDAASTVDVVVVDASPDAPSVDRVADDVGSPDVPGLDVLDVPVDLGTDTPAPVDRPVVVDVPVDVGTPCARAMCGSACVDTATDPRNCGACGRDCTALAGVVAGAVTCRTGSCDLTGACMPGRAHCSADASDGCEADVTTAARCGACATTCSGATPVCAPSGGGYVCQSGCAAPATARCGSTCADTTSDINHCGMCGRACPPVTSGVPTCAASTCGFRCVTGFHACGGACANNADVAACGAACAPCPAPANGRATCDGTSCGATCNDGFHACGTTCASNVAPATCGSSCSPCPGGANATATCDGTRCALVCNGGYTLVGGACVAVAAPRPIAPLSTALVTSRRPTLRWSLAAGTDGAEVDLCRDRACTSILASLTVTGASARPTTDLPAGVVFWRLRGAAGASRGTTLSPVWQFTVGARSAAVDTSWGSACDVNGDGYSDLLVGSPQRGDRAGRAFVHHGSATGAARTATTSLTGPDGAGIHYFGFSVASLGDVNGDGFGDVGISASDTDGAGMSAGPGKVFVYLGRSAGLSPTPVVTLRGPDGTGGGFGAQVAAAGDLNADGYADFAVGAIYANGNRGAAYVFFGGASGPSATPSVSLPGIDGVNGYFGSVAGAGDIDGDGDGDLLIGATGASRAYVYLGSSSGITTTPSFTLVGPDAASSFGDGYAGDFDGDGYSDVAVGARYALSATGRVYVYPGSATGLRSSPAVTLTGPGGANGYFGGAVAVPGDLDGDGYADLAVGADGVSGDAGRVYVFTGRATGLTTTPATTLAGPDTGSIHFGWSVGSFVDVNRDGFADLATGAPYAATEAGRVYVYQGAAAVLPAAVTTTLSSPDGSYSYLGWSVLH